MAPFHSYLNASSSIKIAESLISISNNIEPRTLLYRIMEPTYTILNYDSTDYIWLL